MTKCHLTQGGVKSNDTFRRCAILQNGNVISLDLLNHGSGYGLWEGNLLQLVFDLSFA